MTWRVVLGPEARADYYSAIDYYSIEAEEQVPHFRDEVRKVRAALAENPFLSKDRVKVFVSVRPPLSRITSGTRWTKRHGR